MKRSRHTAVIGLAIVGLLTFAATARAVKVTNLDTGEVLFFDDFEGLGDAVSPSPYPDTVGDYDYDPVAEIGTWTTIGEASGADIQVINSTTAPDPGAFEGSNYLRQVRGAAFTYAYATLSAPQTVADHDGDTIRIESMIWVSSTVNAPAVLGMFDDNNALMAHWVMNNDGTIKILPKSGAVVLETTFAPEEWTYVALDYIIGEDTFSLTIDDEEPVADLPFYDALGSGGVGRIRLAGNAGGGTYWDAVTETVEGLPGDLNGDGSVNSADLDLVRGSWGTTVEPNTGGDADGDGFVSSADLDIVRGNWGTSLPAAAVPEPGMCLLLGLGTFAIMLRRKR